MIRTLQSLRFLFIMLVVVSHFMAGSFEFGGECGVAFFFILSGFVLSLAYTERIRQGTFRTGPFFVRQFSKVYPLHLLTFLFMLALDVRLGLHHPTYILLPNMLLLQSWFPADQFYFVANGSSWFLCDVLFFYIILAPLNKAIMQAGKPAAATVLSTILLSYAALLAFLPEALVNPILYANPLTRTIDFSIGIALYRIYSSTAFASCRQRLARCSFTALTVFELMLVLALIVLAFWYVDLPQRVRTTSLYWLVVPLFILFFATADAKGGLLTMLLRTKAMVWLGGISFELYLIHMPLLRVINSLALQFDYHLTRPTLFLVFCLALLPSSIAVKLMFVDKISKGRKRG